MARGYGETRSQTDTQYGMGRSRTVAVRCYGCQTPLRRAARYLPAIALCPRCKGRVERVYEAQIRAEGIVPSVAPGNGWLPAWARLNSALCTGDRDLIDSLLQAGAAVA